MQQFDPNDRVAKLWGIPGTSKVPSPEKELKKVIDKGKKEFQREVNKLASKAEGETKRVLNKASREITHGLHQVGDEIEDGIKQAAKDAEDAIEDAFYAIAAKLVTSPSTTWSTRSRPSSSPGRSSSSSGGSGSTSTRTSKIDALQRAPAPAQGQAADSVSATRAHRRRCGRVPPGGPVAGGVRWADQGRADRGRNRVRDQEAERDGSLG